MNEHSLLLYGCPYADAIRLNDGRPLREKNTKAMAYVIQRQTAKNRGVAWEFIFPGWVEIWNLSGKWGARGCRKWQYVMARFGDVGPYSKENVEITVCSVNCAAGLLKGINAKANVHA